MFDEPAALARRPGASMPVSMSVAAHKRVINRRDLCVLGASAAGLGLLPGAVTPGFACERVVVGTWGGDFSVAIETTVGAAVKQAVGAEFVASVGAAGARKARLMAEQSRPVGSTDVVCLDTLDMHQMASLGLLAPLDAGAVPNMANIIAGFAHDYAVPLAFSGKVIVYNPDKMPAPSSYRDLWSGAYAGRIGLADLLAVHNIEAAALIAGGSATNYEPGKAKLLELKASGVKLYPSNEALAAALASGDIWATIMWRARGYQWKRAGLAIANVAPEEGVTPITFEAAAAHNAPSMACATAFLNLALAPETQARFAEKIGYLPVVMNAKLAPEIARDLDFSAAERANFFRQDLHYLETNQSQLLDWWTRVFKA
jgi:putative spermidine/putrescine transport system substrate-binding protein